ncbi:MAG: chemotaxis protein CheX [Oceanospirillaceae bacterium]|nr:chemotaxis protein CheX [Oceanospirillaceae bacterium]MCP5349789.1 chemotaxis protein CheX [Oceanospirillaceae bacterium]
MNVQFINPFIESILEVLATMALLEAHSAAPYLKDNTRPLGVISGFIKMEGELVRGSIAISFERETLLQICHNMLGEPVTELNDDARDLVGEITNMLTGGAKRRLWDMGYNFELATPEIHSEDVYRVEHIVQGKVVVIPFTTQAGRFFIEVCFDDARVKAEVGRFTL